MSTLSFYSTIALGGITVIADSCLKRAGQEPHVLNFWFAAGTAIYTASTFGWVYVFRRLSFAEVGVIYSVSVVLMLAITGVVIFKETLKTSECAGVALAIAAIFLLKRFA